jgi:hypothetical protein
MHQTKTLPSREEWNVRALCNNSTLVGSGRFVLAYFPTSQDQDLLRVPVNKQRVAMFLIGVKRCPCFQTVTLRLGSLAGAVVVGIT